MSIKIASEENYKGKEVKLEIDIPDTLVLEDNSKQCMGMTCSSLRTLPFCLFLSGKTIEGDLAIHKEPRKPRQASKVEVTIALFQVESFSINHELDVTNLLTGELVKFRQEGFSYRETILTHIKSSKYKKLQKYSNDALWPKSRLLETLYDDDLSNPSPAFSLHKRKYHSRG